MTRATEVATWAICALVVGGLVALGAPAVTAAMDTTAPFVAEAGTAPSVPTTKPVVDETPEPRDPLQAAAWEIGCDDFAPVGGYAGAARPSPRPDMGATEFAAGTVTYGEDGGVETYTVAAGDAPQALGERFCVDYITLLVANHRFPPGKTIQPGDVLQINP